MKVLVIARKTLRELWREPMLLGLLILFPLMFVGIYYVGFGGGNAQLASILRVSIENRDQGALLPSGERLDAGQKLVDAMQTMSWEGKPVFQVSLPKTAEEADIALRERKAVMAIVIPEDYSEQVVRAMQGGPAAQLILHGNPNSDGYIFAKSFLDESVLGLPETAVSRPPLQATYGFVGGTGTASDFDFGIPGVLIFSVMFITIPTAQILVREEVNRTLRRLRLSSLRSAEFLGGLMLAMTVLAMIQLPVTFAGALLAGFHPKGSLLPVMLLGILLNVGAVGLGFLTACFAKSDSEAANLGAGIGVMSTLVSGAMMPMPKLALFTVAGFTFQIYDLMPPGNIAADAFRRLLTFGDPFSSIWVQVAGMVVVNGLYLLIGIALYQRLRLRKA